MKKKIPVAEVNVEARTMQPATVINTPYGAMTVASIKELHFGNKIEIWFTDGRKLLTFGNAQMALAA